MFRLVLEACVRSLPILALLLLGPASWAQSRPAAWEVRSATGKVTILGSIHAGQKDFYPLPPALEEAWKGAKALAVEADVQDPLAAVAVAPKMILFPPDRLEHHLSPAGWKKVQQRMKHPRVQQALTQAGLPVQGLGLLRPWALALSLSVAPALQAGLDPSEGIDLHFLKRARAEQRPIRQLESVSQQVDLLASLPKADQEAFLLDALDDLATGKASREMAGMVTAWSKGDLKAIQGASRRKNRAPRPWMRALLEGRHPAMVQTISDWLATSDPVFLVVGAAHLPGPEGLIAQLKARGFEVSPLAP